MHNQRIFPKNKEKKSDNTAHKNREHVLPKSGSLLRAAGMKPKNSISKNEWLFFSKLCIITDSIKGGFFQQNQTNPIQR